MGGRRRASESLELKIETVMSYPKWPLEIELQFSARAANAAPPPSSFHVPVSLQVFSNANF